MIWYAPGSDLDREARAYATAREEHAIMLRLEGLTFDQIGARLGTGRENARHIFHRGARRLRWATRNTRLTMEPAANA